MDVLLQLALPLFAAGGVRVMPCWRFSVLMISCLLFTNQSCGAALVCSQWDRSKLEWGKEKCKFNDNKTYCFTSWINSTDGQVQVTGAGCWLNDEGCEKHTECVETREQNVSDMKFCCCVNSMCNTVFHYEPDPEQYEEMEAYRTSSREETGLVRRTNGHPLGRTIIYSVLPIVMLVAVIITVFFMYRRHRLASGRAHTQLPTMDPSYGDGFFPVSSAPLKRPPLNLQLLEPKAQGRYGSVWKAQIPGQLVAVKMFPVSDKQSWLAELEVYSLPRMKHDNILKFIACEEREQDQNDAAKLWLITEYHDNGSLCDYLKGNTVTWAELCRIGETMACGLAYLHDEIPDYNGQKGKPAVAHRDLKSKNVLLKHDLTACIADFGLALKFEPGKGLNETHSQVGTRRYMAPEVLEGAICFSRDSFLRIDMYACGLIIWELMTRCTAVDGPVNDYRLPFEVEVGQQPSLEVMHSQVVIRKVRPSLNPLWYKHPGLYGLIPTVEECWDQDAEARLSAGCVKERISQLCRTVNSQFITDQQESDLYTACVPASPHSNNNQHLLQEPPQLPPPPQQTFIHSNNTIANNNSVNSGIMMNPGPPPPPLPIYVARHPQNPGC